MPRAGPPGPFKSAAAIHRVPFNFDSECRRQLIDRLAHDLQVPAPGSVIASSIAVIEKEAKRSVAERIVDTAEEQIILLHSARADDVKTAPANPTNIRKAIEDLKAAMKPFLEGWVDPVTAGIADWCAIDAALTRREAALKVMPRRKPDEAVRFNANVIFSNAHQMARAAGFEISKNAAERFTAAVLDAANVKHPEIHEHPGRFSAWLDGE
jgi:hypothetical protein